MSNFVVGADGTRIAFDQIGSGPSLLLVHGTGTIGAPWAPIPVAIAVGMAGGLTDLRGLAAALNSRGVPTARGGRWHVSNVRNLLARSRQTRTEQPLWEILRGRT